MRGRFSTSDDVRYGQPKGIDQLTVAQASGSKNVVGIEVYSIALVYL